MRRGVRQLPSSFGGPKRISITFKKGCDKTSSPLEFFEGEEEQKKKTVIRDEREKIYLTTSLPTRL